MGKNKLLEVSDVFGLSDPLCKLVECVSRGVGKVYEPTHIKRMAKARTEEIKTISSAVNENIDLPVTYDSGDIKIDSSNTKDLLERTGNRLVFQEVQKQQNIESVIGHAYIDLEKEEIVSEEKVDTDWILRFMRSVEDISNEQMQELWGKILAGEIKQPKTYSLRMLETLRNISISEAECFEKLAKFVLNINGNLIIYNDRDLMDTHNIYFEDMLLLEECGLINSSDLVLKIKINNDNYTTVNNSSVIGFIKSTELEFKEVSLPIYSLLESGKQLYRTLEINGSKDYAIDAMNIIKNKFATEDYIVISAHEIITIENGINYKMDDILATTN